jgi:hypothetical protein
MELKTINGLISGTHWVEKKNPSEIRSSKALVLRLLLENLVLRFGAQKPLFWDFLSGWLQLLRPLRAEECCLSTWIGSSSRKNYDYSEICMIVGFRRNKKRKKKKKKQTQTNLLTLLLLFFFSFRQFWIQLDYRPPERQCWTFFIMSVAFLSLQGVCECMCFC